MSTMARSADAVSASKKAWHGHAHPLHTPQTQPHSQRSFGMRDDGR